VSCHIQTLVPASAEMLFASLTRWGTNKCSSYSRQTTALRGNVTRILTLFFFINQLLLDSSHMPRKDFKFLNILGDICFRIKLPGVFITGESRLLGDEHTGEQT
jgi:hypothetical protein